MVGINRHRIPVIGASDIQETRGEIWRNIRVTVVILPITFYFPSFPLYRLKSSIYLEGKRAWANL
jgi:hypothetical protein